jgi:dynein light chain 1
MQAGIEKLTNLRVLFIANNKVSSWSEVDRLAVLDKLEDLLLSGVCVYVRVRVCMCMCLYA